MPVGRTHLVEVSTSIGEGVRDGSTPYKDRTLCFVWAKQGWVVKWTQLSNTSGSLTALDALLLILTRISHLFSFLQRCLGDIKRVPWVGLGSRLKVQATELGRGGRD